MMLESEFTDQVKDALSHLYDYMYLQTHPLADFLVTKATGDGIRAKMLRQILLQAIEELKPEADIPLRSPEWRGYRILYIRYVEGLDVEEITAELAISRSQFYREHRKALDAVAALLWDRISQSSMLEEEEQSQEADSGEAFEDLIQAEIERLILHSTKETLALDQVIEGMRSLFLEFAAAKEVQLQLEVPEALPPIHAGHTVLRQILLNGLSQGLKWASPGGIVTLAAAESGDQVIVEVIAEGLPPEGYRGEDEEETSSLVVARRLVESQEGQMQLLWDKRAIRIVLPIANMVTVLAVDDNEDIIRLFRRYLNGHDGYQVVGAQSSEEALRLALKLKPQIITLDVMMPNRDGWEALQTLKNHPLTCDIPVLVCSILDEPELAFSLGAWGFLRKPISQEALLAALERLRTSPGNEAPGHPG